MDQNLIKDGYTKRQKDIGWKEKKRKKKRRKKEENKKNKQKTEMPLWKRIDPTRKQNKNNKRNKMKQNETTKDYAKKLKIECTEDFL